MLVPDYRMGPENPFPAAVEDGVKAWKHLLEAGIDPARMVIAGDSAGGGLTLATALALRDQGLPQPAGLFCISPWADLRQVGKAYEAVQHLDPMISVQGLGDFASSIIVGFLWVLHPTAAMSFVIATSLIGAAIIAGTRTIAPAVASELPD